MNKSLWWGHMHRSSCTIEEKHMFNQGKYVVGTLIDCYGSHCVTAVCIPESVPHSLIRRLFNEVHSAGFFSVNNAHGDINVQCYGESVSLELTCDAENDSLLVARTLGLED